VGEICLSDQPEMVFTLPVVVKLLCAVLRLGLVMPRGILAFCTVTSRYWLPYPILPRVLGRACRRTAERPLSFSFWQGALMVCAGSLLCWYATRNNARSAGQFQPGSKFKNKM
jgi:hypothetical protein